MHLATIPSPVRWPGQVLSRYPVLESRIFSHYGPRDDVVPPLSRCAGAVRIQVEGGRQLWVFVIHLHPSDRTMRNVEADLVIGHVRRLLLDCQDIVVLGDFNCEISERIHVLLEDQGFGNAMQLVGGGLRPTVDTAGKKHKRVIDHIYVSESLIPRLKAAQVVTSPGFRHDDPREPGMWDYSDHLPVWVELA